MGHFIGRIQGARGETSRLGSRQSGISASIKGWHNGVNIYGGWSKESGDVFEIHATGGSTGGHRSKLIGVVRVVDGKLVCTNNKGEDIC